MEMQIAFSNLPHLRFATKQHDNNNWLNESRSLVAYT